MQRTRIINLYVLCGLALALTLAPTALAGDGCALEHKAHETQATAETAEAPLAGMRVVIDPETGELRAPTAEEGARLFGIPEGQMPEQSVVQEPAIERPDGSLLLQFRSSFLKAAVATVGEDGQVTVNHHQDSVAMPAHTVLNAPAAAQQEVDEETTEEKEGTP